ncbi:MAG: amidase [Alphaproteobacteria bacterium]|nr:amidase [Alphaproteobacteria bacterium]
MTTQPPDLPEFTGPEFTGPEFTGPDLCRLQAHELVALLKKGEVSPRDCLDAAFTRIEAVEPTINAMPTTCPERAYAAAENLEGDTAHPGWLAGLPLGIKDLNPVAGVRTTFGTRAFADFVPDKSDPLVARIEARGGIVAGKTNTPEMGAGANTFNTVFGATLNPWDTVLNPGGSSGGAAAGLATGEVWLSHGSDHGGSLRTPAAYCGIVGMRPSPGRAASASPAGFMTEGTQGPMARSVRDCALFLDCMAGHTPSIPISFPGPEGGSFQDAVIAATPKIRVGFSADFNGMAQVDIEVLDHLKMVLGLVEGTGATVEEACPELANLERTYFTLRGMDMAITARNMPEEVKRHFKQTLIDNMAYGRSMSVDDVADAHLNRTVIFNNMVEFFASYDVLACPVVGCMPHPQTEEWVRVVGGKELTGYMDWLRFAFLATTAGLPSISVPVGPGPRGLPIGIQLIGKPRGEAALLAAAQVFETATGGPKMPIDPAGA